MALQAIKMTMSAGEPAVAAPPPVVVAGSDVPGKGGGGGGVVTGPLPLQHVREEEVAVVLSADDHLTDEDFSDEEDDDDEEDADSDSEFEDEDGVEAAATGVPLLLATSVFLGRLTPSASVQNTTGFMRLAAAMAAPGEKGGGGEILVHYRYIRFLRAQSGGVDMHVLGPKLAHVRFHLPSHHAAASGPASTLLSLRLAGATLAALLYPARFSVQLRELWTVLIAEARVPPQAAGRLVVNVDVGILRPRDCTPERMTSMRAALEAVARERDGTHSLAFDVGPQELRLPAPLASEDDVRPAKRRKVTGEDCPICCEVLEKDLAAWPRCSHIFHGRCLEEHLLRGSQECPMCRSRLEVDGKNR